MYYLFYLRVIYPCCLLYNRRDSYFDVLYVYTYVGVGCFLAIQIVQLCLTMTPTLPMGTLSSDPYNCELHM